MFLTIVRKELLANILTFKFLTGFVLCVVLIVSSAYLLTKSYEERLRNYNDSVRKHQAELQTAMVYSEVRPTWITFHVITILLYITKRNMLNLNA